VLDVCLPGISGYEVCHRLRGTFGEALPIMFVSAGRTESYDRVAGFLIGGDDYANPSSRAEAQSSKRPSKRCTASGRVSS